MTYNYFAEHPLNSVTLIKLPFYLLLVLQLLAHNNANVKKMQTVHDNPKDFEFWFKKKMKMQLISI